MICCLNPDCSNPQNPDSKKFCQACSTPLVPFLRNRFRVMRVLSDEGGFGRTYLSEDTDKLNEYCVIKQLAPKFQGTWSQRKAIELFAQEAKRLQQLGEHAQIPSLLAYFEQDNCLYLVQQFINGQNLLKELQVRKVYRDWDIQSILWDLLPVIKFVHSRGVIHRDIKPENIIRQKQDGKLVLIDFGSSKQLSVRVQQKVGTSIGSHGYAPIEQIRDGKAYPASDLFSLGATCFHLLTGISPFQLWMEYGYSWVNHWQSYLRFPLSYELTQVLDKLLQKEIQNRYQSVDEVIRDLTSKTKSHPSSAAILKVPGNTPDNKQKFQFVAYPQKYVFLRNLILVMGAIVVLGIGQSGYDQIRRIQAFLSANLNQTHDVDNSEVSFSQSPKKSSGDITLVKTLLGNNHEVSSVAISPDGKTIASNSDRDIKLWDLIAGEEIGQLKGHSQRVNVVAISPNGRLLVSGSDDDTIKVWNLATGQLIYTLTGHRDAIHTLAISGDGRILVSGSDDDTIKVWNLATGKLVRTIAGHAYWVRSVTLSPDGITLASGSFDKTIKLWNLNQGRIIRTLTPNSQTVTALAFSPNGKLLVSASRDRQIKFWNMDTEREVRSLNGAADDVTSLAFNPSGKILAIASRDRQIKLWNMTTGGEITRLLGHTNAVTSLAFSADGTILVSGGEDSQIKIWRISD
jgi:WD40 repeat protein